MSRLELPEEAERLLLLAATRTGEGAIQAWQQWKATGRTAQEAGSAAAYRRLPLVFHQLHHTGVLGAETPVLKGAWKFHAVNNSRLAQTAATRIKTLEQAGIRTMLTGPLALAFGYYTSSGLRPLSQAELLVDSATTDIDLAEVSLQREPLPGGPAGWWERSKPFSFYGARTRLMGPTDALLQVCVQGGLGASPHFDWIADAAIMLAHPIDWSLFLAEVRTRDLAPPVARAVRALVEVMALPVPTAVSNELDRMARRQWIFSEMRHGAWIPSPLLRGYVEYRSRGTGGWSAYLQQRWNLAHPWQVLPEAVARLRDRWIRWLRRRG